MIDIKEGAEVVDTPPAGVSTLIGDLTTGLAYFCDPRQDFGEWHDTNDPLAYRLIVDDNSGNQAWGHIGDRCIGIPYDNLAGGNFSVGDTVFTGIPDNAVVVATSVISATEGLLIVTIANPGDSFDDNEPIQNGLGVTANVNTSGGAGGGVSVTSATYNACELYSLKAGGTQNWVSYDSAFAFTDTPLTYEVRGALYQNPGRCGLELGTTLTNIARLSLQGIPIPHVWTYVPFSRVEPRGDGGALGLGFGTASWQWRNMSQAQVARLLAYFSSPVAPSVDVILWTYIDTGMKRTLVRFSGKMSRPVDGSGKAMLTGSFQPAYNNITVAFSRLQEYV